MIYRKFTGALLLLLLALSPFSSQAGMEEAEATFVRGNYKEALEEYKTLARGGNAEAAFYAGVLYDKGLGSEANKKTAFKWYKMSAEGGYPQAQFIVAMIYLAGEIVPENQVLGKQWLEKSAAQGLKEAQSSLKMFFAAGLFKENKPPQQDSIARDSIAAEVAGTATATNSSGSSAAPVPEFIFYKNKSPGELQKAATDGDASAQLTLAIFYRQGTGVRKNPAEAFKWAKKAADQNMPFAKFMLAGMYLTGRGVGKNQDLGITLMQQAFKQGVAEAGRVLQQFLIVKSPDGVGSDGTMTLEQYRAAANRSGSAQSEFNLGLIYQFGWGTEKDTDEAIRWYTRAANQGNDKAALILSGIYGNGDTGKADMDKAMMWLKTAARLGNKSANDTLLEMKAAGINVEQTE